MRALEFVLVGGVIGILAVAAYRALNPGFNPNAGIDPTTGGVQLAPDTAYGPPAPADYVTEGLTS